MAKSNDGTRAAGLSASLLGGRRRCILTVAESMSGHFYRSFDAKQIEYRWRNISQSAVT
jgi:hypothetical protein